MMSLSLTVLPLKAASHLDVSLPQQVKAQCHICSFLDLLSLLVCHQTAFKLCYLSYICFQQHIYLSLTPVRIKL